MKSQERIELLDRFHAETDPAKREPLGLTYAAEDLECLVAQIRDGRIQLRRVANYLSDLVAELTIPPGRVMIKIDDPPVPLRSKDLTPPA